jgi:hypothetical protein
MRTEQETPIKNLSLISHHFRSILTPFFFKTLSINKPIRQLTQNQLISQYAQTLKIDMFGSLWWWCSGSYTSSSDALDLFTNIQSLKAIRTLEISMMKRSIDIFIAAFEAQSDQITETFVLDNVEELVVTSSAAFLTSHCPRLKSLVIRDDGSECILEPYTDLSKRLAPLHAGFIDRTPHLTSFDATAIWSAHEISCLVASFPYLRHLRMRSDTYCYRACTPTIIETLGDGLKDLRTLQLVKSGSLGMGYLSVWKRRIQACSNAEYRRMLWRENERLRVQVENEVVRAAFGRMESLRVCWLGEKRVARRCEDADADKLQWMWERRSEDVDECVMDSQMFASLRMEKESVVVGSEIGF